MNQPGYFLNAYLSGIRNRILRRMLFEGALWLISILLGLFLVCALGLLLGLPGPLLRLVFWFGATAALGAFTFQYVVHPRRIYADPANVAAFLERREPALREKLISASEFTREPAPSYSPELAEAAVTQIENELRGLDPTTVIPGRSLRRVFWRLLAALLLAAVLVAASRGTARNLWSVLRGGYAGPALAAGDMHFLAGDVTLSYTYPDYTGLSPLTVENSSGDIEALPGTVVRVAVTAAVPATEAALVLDKGGEIAMERADGRRFEGVLTVVAKDSYYFQFDGEADGRTRSIEAVNDREPFVALDFPPSEFEVRETDRLELSYRVEDDFGLGAIRLHINLDTGKKREDRVISLAAAEGGKKNREGTWEWDLAPLRLIAGDRVTYFLEAEDNDTVNGPKKGRSAVHTLKVFSVNEHHKNLLDRQEKIWEAMIELLAKYLVQVLDETSIPSDASLISVFSGTEAELTQAILDPLGSLVKDLKDDPLTMDSVRDLLEAAQQDFTRHRDDYARERQRLSAYPAGPSFMSMGFYRLRGLRQGTIERLERRIIELSGLLEKQKMDSLVSESQRLSELRDELRQLMEEYRKNPDPALKERIERMLKDFRDKLRELQERMAQVNKELPEEFVNPDSMPTQSMENSLEKLEALMAKGDLEAAFNELEALSRDLNDMMGKMKDGSEELGDSLYGESMKKLMNFEKDLDQLTQKQEDVLRQTKSAAETLRQAAERMAKKDLDGLMKRLESKVEAAKKEAGAVKATFSTRAQQYRDGALERLSDLQNAMRAGDVNAALETAESALRQLEMAKAMLGYNEFGMPMNAGEDAKHADEAMKKTSEVRDELRKTMPDPQKLLSKEERDKLGELARRQAELGNEAQRLRQDARKMMEEMPFMPGDSGDLMDMAAQGMEQSRSELERSHAPRAADPQQQAVHSMKSLREGLDKAQQQMQQNMKFGGMKPGLRQGQGLRKMEKEKVAIPKAEDYKTPKELREDLLEAMKRKAPKAYEPQNRQYYKELVQ